jgi:predicted dinucleotide-binding enzyme
VARNLVGGGEPDVLAARDDSRMGKLVKELGPMASSPSVSQAIADADTIVLALWLGMLMELVIQNNDFLKGKVIVDPTNPI